MFDITALDLSLTGTGWATYERNGEGIRTGRITTKLFGCARIDAIMTRLAPLLDARLVAVEGPSFASNMAMAHEGAGLWWQVYMRLWHLGQETVVITPHSLQKYATGKGVGDKPAVTAEAARRFPHVPIHSSDEADALWLLAMCCEYYKNPICDMPAVNREALYRVVPKAKGKPAHPAIRWPDIQLWQPAA